jgi:hypothetical protein
LKDEFSSHLVPQVDPAALTGTAYLVHRSADQTAAPAAKALLASIHKSLRTEGLQEIITRLARD